MKIFKYLSFIAALALLPSFALARNPDEHSLDLTNQVKVGKTELQPGTYKVEWQGSGPAVNVNFMKHGKTVVTVPATLKTQDKLAFQDDVVTDATKSNVRALREIDFGHDKEALLFGHTAM